VNGWVRITVFNRIEFRFATEAKGNSVLASQIFISLASSSVAKRGGGNVWYKRVDQLLVRCLELI